MTERINRREFLGAAAIAGFAYRSSASETNPPRVKLGLIGCGGYGLSDVRAAFKAGGVDVIALCDVDSQHLEDSANQVEGLQGARPKTFKHYADLLETPGLAAVIIETPPQWHALPFLAAIEKNLDIYCEKPLAYDIREGRTMIEAARKRNVIVQIGFQRRQSPAIQATREYVRQGKLGRIIQADAQIHYTAGIKDTTPQDPPASLDWDLWCGPAPKVPYSPQIGHVSWRLERTTGHGHLVDWGIHLIDATRYILGETVPRSVQASGGIYCFKDKITTPDILSVHFEFDTCPVFWKHRIWGAQEYTPEVANGVFLYGENGTIFVTDNRWVIIPKDKNQQRVENKVAGDMGTAHMAEFLDAVRTREPCPCTVEEGYRSTTAVKLAMIAYETGTRVVWDEKSEQIVGNPAAAGLVMRPYRAPWKHPYRN